MIPFNMHVVADVCASVTPLGVNTVSLSKEISIYVQEIIQRSGLNHMMHGYGTNLKESGMM